MLEFSPGYVVYLLTIQALRSFYREKGNVHVHLGALHTEKLICCRSEMPCINF